MFRKILVIACLSALSSAAPKPGVGHEVAVDGPTLAYSAGAALAPPLATANYAAPVLAYGAAFGYGAGIAAPIATSISAASFSAPALTYGAGVGYSAGLGYGTDFEYSPGIGYSAGLGYSGW